MASTVALSQSSLITTLRLLLPRLSPRVWSEQSSSTSQFSRRLTLPLLPSLPIAIPAAFHLNLPSLLPGLWESILRAVPKKKTSHSKSRHRQMAGKALKDVTTLNKCPACGNLKRRHYLCPYCVKTHPTDIFSLAVTPTQIISASGASSIKVHDTTQPESPLVQTIEGAHKLGCHHLVASRNGRKAASVGFGGEAKIWNFSDDAGWKEEGRVVASVGLLDGSGTGELWAIALSEDGQYLASTTYDGRINVWDTAAERTKIREYETKGSFGMCIDLSADGRFTATGHENGSVYVFNNDTGRMLHSLPGLVKSVRTIAFSPGGKLLAAAGDSGIISLYDVASGEQVANLTGSAAWVFAVDWSDTGEFLLSGTYDGKARVWSVDQRVCVATHTETDKPLWSVKWLPKKVGMSERFATAGATQSISFYREATGG
ncbi:hypothetical protein FGG08_002065 [Glutinoglossum americanum]|uniref:Uncharacterized protein n=1 Tax=Glutinoglossum americanum TaxID=1670608 RepID=A0A9P8I5L0_9PEZI|nr:hypothetical protein FGG08_002065 [Glutinoglossum americanum]